jgi:hypothetical protein
MREKDTHLIAWHGITNLFFELVKVELINSTGLINQQMNI